MSQPSAVFAPKFGFFRGKNSTAFTNIDNFDKRAKKLNVFFTYVAFFVRACYT